MLTFGQRLFFSDQPPSPLGRIREVGWMTGIGCGPRNLDAYALVFLYEGEGTLLDSKQRQSRVEKGDLILVRPGVAHEYHPDPKIGWREVYFIFDGPVFDAWENSGLFELIDPVLRLEPIDFWLRRFLAVLQIDVSKSGVPYFVEIARLFSLIAEILVIAGGSDPASGRVPWLHQACVLLHRPANEKLPLAEVAQKVGLSYSSFSRQFGRHMGMPPSAYRMQWLINEASEMMVNTGKGDKEIAFELGFDHMAYFYDRFRRVTGRSPSVFRLETAKARERDSTRKSQSPNS